MATFLVKAARSVSRMFFFLSVLNCNFKHLVFVI